MKYHKITIKKVNAFGHDFQQNASSFFSFEMHDQMLVLFKIIATIS